jgi:hypothetical protein
MAISFIGVMNVKHAKSLKVEPEGILYLMLGKQIISNNIDDGVFFKHWNGILINCCTLEIQVDYTMY